MTNRQEGAAESGKGGLGSRHLHFEEHGLVFRELTAEADFRAAYRLRYKICVEQLHWVQGVPEEQLEYDDYDKYSYHFGCFRESKLIGYMRMTPEDNSVGTMSRDHFGHLWQIDPQYPTHETADLSRLLVDRPYLHKPLLLRRILIGLYRLAYGRAELSRPRIRYWYFITTGRLLKALRWQLGLPVKVFGHDQTSDGKTTYAVGLDLQRGRRRLAILAPWRLIYFARAKRLQRDNERP
ncbi:MAG TPA: GNAT family N-acyltransferase [Candidatus Saccharimonadia bacterium]|nr:GNAT family N-acyltransferase [Candidatus Saccharimonadia bacterium]